MQKNVCMALNKLSYKQETGEEPIGRVTSWVRVPVGAGDTVEVTAEQ